MVSCRGKAAGGSLAARVINDSACCVLSAMEALCEGLSLYVRRSLIAVVYTKIGLLLAIKPDAIVMKED